MQRQVSETGLLLERYGSVYEVSTAQLQKLHTPRQPRYWFAYGAFALHFPPCGALLNASARVRPPSAA